MNDKHTHIHICDVDVDELWIREWVQAGLEELEGYLAKHAAFADFLRQRGDLAPRPPRAGAIDLSAYLFTTTRNLFLKSVERGKRQQPVDEVPEPDEPQPIGDMREAQRRYRSLVPPVAALADLLRNVVPDRHRLLRPQVLRRHLHRRPLLHHRPRPQDRLARQLRPRQRRDRDVRPGGLDRAVEPLHPGLGRLT